MNKYSKKAVWAFILTVSPYIIHIFVLNIPFILYLIPYRYVNGFFNPLILSELMIVFIGFWLGVISLKETGKNKLKGRVFSVISIVLCIFPLSLFILLIFIVAHMN